MTIIRKAPDANGSRIAQDRSADGLQGNGRVTGQELRDTPRKRICCAKMAQLRQVNAELHTLELQRLAWWRRRRETPVAGRRTLVLPAFVAWTTGCPRASHPNRSRGTCLPASTTETYAPRANHVLVRMRRADGAGGSSLTSSSVRPHRICVVVIRSMQSLATNRRPAPVLTTMPCRISPLSSRTRSSVPKARPDREITGVPFFSAAWARDGPHHSLRTPPAGSGRSVIPLGPMF
jgi:hypothetical protein